MARLLLGLAIGVPFFALGGVFGAWWTGRRSAEPTTSERELEFRERMATLQHHTDLLERARRASLDGEPGLANIYSEAADRVLEMLERPSPEP